MPVMSDPDASRMALMSMPLGFASAPCVSAPPAFLMRYSRISAAAPATRGVAMLVPDKGAVVQCEHMLALHCSKAQ